MERRKIGFIITAFDTKRELNFTVDMLRNKWKRTKDSPISIVISGDPERSVRFPNDPITRVTTLDNMVKDDFNGLVSTSIMKQMRHGMIELQDLERHQGKQVDYIVHMHGDILLMSEDGFFAELEKFIASAKVIAGDTVGPQVTDYIHFEGLEIMPQLFVVDRNFIGLTGFMLNMYVVGDLEKRSTEWAIRGNLIRNYNSTAHSCSSDKEVIEKLLHNVAPSRTQSELHSNRRG